ncbi:AI-2E family transporter [Paenibacillus sp. PK3_47]|uniref:AI-2E family transporter n=1 Tax=Paenibacillus sp. PK3_47 TaxID=2072642 RepID=UPI00201E6F2C|nr:AI-2E family transporter [Paenibacillus sp. PK3_47]UQZ36123.1 AI-2E family transporter [Paenibacillus sp. PK3_47]
MILFEKLQTNVNLRRFLILMLIAFVIYLIRDMLNLILLTLLIAFIMNSIQVQLSKQISRFVNVNSKVIVIALYISFIAVITILLIKYLPIVYEQFIQLATFLTNLRMDDLPQNKITLYLFDSLKGFNYQAYLNSGVEYILKISNWSTNFLLSIILSFIFILEKNRIIKFTSKLKDSTLGWIYREVEYLSGKFITSFGKVIEAQILIALINTLITVIGLWLLGFPYLLALAIMVFLLSLIPVFGFVISLIPLSIIAYNIGGLQTTLYVLIMVAVIHFAEGYFLNPKLMSSKMNLPMFVTLIVLFFSEHYIGVWGLIIGIPIFLFLLDIIEVDRS